MRRRPLNDAPTWLRMTVRVAVLIWFWPFHLAGMFAEWIYETVDPYLPRGRDA